MRLNGLKKEIKPKVVFLLQVVSPQLRNLCIRQRVSPLHPRLVEIHTANPSRSRASLLRRWEPTLERILGLPPFSESLGERPPKFSQKDDFSRRMSLTGLVGGAYIRLTNDGGGAAGGEELRSCDPRVGRHSSEPRERTSSG